MSVSSNRGRAATDGSKGLSAFIPSTLGAPFIGSKRKTGHLPASASYSSGLGPVTRPAFFRNPTPLGTATGNSRNNGLASSAGSSTTRTRSVLRPCRSVASPAARALAAQSLPGRPPSTYRLPSTVIGVIGVERGLPDLRPRTVRITGPLPPNPKPSRCTPIITLLTYFSHHGGRMRSLYDIPATLRDGVDAEHGAAARQRAPPRRACHR